MTSNRPLGFHSPRGEWGRQVETDRLLGLHCQCFMETYTGDLAKASTNKDYQERKRDSIWKNEKIYSHYSNELMIDT
jgi:hypothetical protein